MTPDTIERVGPEPFVRNRLWVRGLMVMVAAVCLAAYCSHFSLGCFVSCVLALALIRTSETANRLQSEGLSNSRSMIIRDFLLSAIIASAILLISLVPALCVLPIFNIPRMHEIPELGGRHILGILVSATTSIPVVVLLKRRLW